MSMRVELVSVRIYRRMMWLYPASFREEYGRDIVHNFRDCCRDAVREGGGFLIAGLWLHAVLDLITTAVKEHVAGSGIRSANMIDTTAFDSQLVSSLLYWTRALRNGYNVLQSVEMIAKNAPEPTASAFRAVLDKVAEGTPLAEAIEDLKTQIGSEHLNAVIDTMMSQRQTGGNLADMFDDLNAAMRQQLGDDGWAQSHIDKLS